MNCLEFSRQHQDDVDNEKVEAYSSLPRLSFESPASKICCLTDIDADLNMPFESNFAYYTPHDLHSNYDINQCFLQNQNFSIINCNIRSLSANFGNMTDMLSSIFFPFSLIGITETKIRRDHSPIMNIDLPGYQFVSQPTLSDWGGVPSISKIIYNSKLGQTCHLKQKTMNHCGLKSTMIPIQIEFVVLFIDIPTRIWTISSNIKILSLIK